MKTTTQFQLFDVNKLISCVNNARIHSKEQITKLRSSLREFGFVNLIIIDEDFNVIAGHGRLEAAKAESIAEVPCMFVNHLTDAQKKAYIIADNRMAIDVGWDNALLAVEMEELQNLGVDLGLTGFDEDEKELADLFASDEDIRQDDFDVDAELEKPCFSQSGDIWHLGKHTVICGDSTLPETYTALLGDTKVNLVCTDSPYLVNLESTLGKIKNDDLDNEKGYAFLKSAFERFHETMAKDASIYVFYATSKARVFHDAYEYAGFKVGAGLIWKKDRLVFTRTDWKYIHKPIIWGWRKDGKHIWYNGNRRIIAIECIMSSAYNNRDKKSEDNAAKLAMALLKKYNLSIDCLYTYTHWLNVRDEKFGTVDYLNTAKNPYKMCPLYILQHWLNLRKKYRII